MSRMYLYAKFIKMWNEREIAGMTEVEREEYNSVGQAYPDFVDDLQKSVANFCSQVSIRMFQINKSSLSIKEYENVVNEYLESMRKKYGIKLTDADVDMKIRDLFMRLSPLVMEDDQFTYMHSSYKDYFLIQYIVNDFERLLKWSSKEDKLKQHLENSFLNNSYLDSDYESMEALINSLQIHSKINQI